MAERVKDCPECRAEDAIEAVLRIVLDDVVVEDGKVVEFVPAASAENSGNGIVTSDPVCRVSCRECGEEIAAYVPVALTDRWTYAEPERQEGNEEPTDELLDPDGAAYVCEPPWDAER